MMHAAVNAVQHVTYAIWRKMMTRYQWVIGTGDTITCDDCSKQANDWLADDYHAICKECYQVRIETNA